MAKLIHDPQGVTHLRGDSVDHALCGVEVVSIKVSDGVLECPHCAAKALLAIELTTKGERREWRKL